MLIRQIQEVRRRGKCKVRNWRFGERFVVLGMKEGRDGNRRAGFSGICAVYTRNMRLTFRFPFNDTTWTRAKPNAANADPGDVSHSNWESYYWPIETIRVDEETLIHLVLYRMLVRSFGLFAGFMSCCDAIEAGDWSLTRPCAVHFHEQCLAA